jgi:peptide/nickel transport system permease protein
MSMLTFIAKRIAAVIILIFLLATVAFILFRVMPSDPAAMMVSPRMSPDMKEVLREQYGLDKSLGYQYYVFIKNGLNGDLGVSFYWATTVSEILKGRIASTAILVGTGIIIAAFIDASATASGKKSGIINTLFYLIPFLFLGLVLIWIFSYKMDLFPVGGMKSPELWAPRIEASAGAKLTDVLYHLFLPLTLIVVWIMVGFLPLVKTVSTGIIKEKKSLLPTGLTTLFAGSALFFGAMATETIFSWPGFHATFIEASLNYDYPLAVGAVIAGFVFMLIVAACTEVFYAVIASLKG